MLYDNYGILYTFKLWMYKEIINYYNTAKLLLQLVHRSFVSELQHLQSRYHIAGRCITHDEVSDGAPLQLCSTTEGSTLVAHPRVFTL